MLTRSNVQGLFVVLVGTSFSSIFAGFDCFPSTLQLVSQATKKESESRKLAFFFYSQNTKAPFSLCGGLLDETNQLSTCGNCDSFRGLFYLLSASFITASFSLRHALQDKTFVTRI